MKIYDLLVHHKNEQVSREAASHDHIKFNNNLLRKCNELIASWEFFKPLLLIELFDDSLIRAKLTLASNSLNCRSRSCLYFSISSWASSFACLRRFCLPENKFHLCNSENQWNLHHFSQLTLSGLWNLFSSALFCSQQLLNTLRLTCHCLDDCSIDFSWAFYTKTIFSDNLQIFSVEIWGSWRRRMKAWMKGEESAFDRALFEFMKAVKK